jgi:hypothetical protein
VDYVMQTFLPYLDPWQTAKVLDRKRLGKQRVEGKQILNILTGLSDNPWKSHPAVRMWRGFETLLKYYVNIMMLEWTSRGYENNMVPYNIEGMWKAYPLWINDKRLFYSHRANLIRKLPEHYRELWPEVDPNTPYWWPVELKTKKQQEYLNDFWGHHVCEITNNNTIILVEDNSNYERDYQSWHYSYD